MPPPSKRCPALQALSHRLRSEAREGLTRFDRFLAGDEFRRRWDSIPARLRRRAVLAISQAADMIPDTLPRPVKALPMGEGKRCNWADPRQRARLRQVYAKCGDDHEKAGRMLRVTADAARLARKRYLDAAPTLRMAA